MIANIKQITLEDGTVVSFEDRVNEDFIQVKMGPKYYELVHIKAFFDKHVKVPGLLDLLLKKEASIKRAEARALKKAEKEASSADKSKEEPKEIPALDDNADIQGVAVVEPEEVDLPPESTEPEEEPKAEKPKAEKKVSKPKAEKKAEPKKEEPKEDPSSNLTVVDEVEDIPTVPAEVVETSDAAQEAIDEVVSEIEEASVIESGVPEFENKILKNIAAALDGGKIGNVAAGKMLVIGAPGTEGFVQKITEWTAADKIYQIPFFKSDIPVYPTIKASEVKKCSADVIVLSTKPEAAFEHGKNALEGLKAGGTLFMIYSAEHAKDETAYYSEYNELISNMDALTIDVEGCPLVVDKIVKNV